MAMMMGNLCAALRESGASDEGARKAAEEVASYDARFAKVESSQALLQCMMGFNLAISAAILARLLLV